jgi:CheY-like chemotaxis protein
MNNQPPILWVDDEIDVLRPHIILLQQRGFNVETATNGADAIELAREKNYGLVFLDESMVGLSGLDTLIQLKAENAQRPVVMVTKNEQESIMEEAIGRKIDDYLTKPVNPAQILAVCKKYLETKKITEQKVTQDYMQSFAQISAKLYQRLEWSDWVDIYQKLVAWSIELDAHPELGFDQTLRDQWRECNQAFSTFVEENYQDWLTDKPSEGNPILSPHIMDEFVVPSLKQQGKNTIFFVLDCMRLDQWQILEELILPLFSVRKSYYSSILPTATPYSRNAIFSGLYPKDLQKHYPQWAPSENDEEHKQNAHEKDLLQSFLKRRMIELRNDVQYIKIIDTDFGKKIENDIHRIAKNHCTAIVVNAMDMIAHSRSDYAILKEIAPDESAYRTLTKSWFQHSSLYGMLKTLSTMKDVNIIITTDHGSIRCLRGVKAFGDRETSTNLRYKMGKNVKADSRHALLVNKPEQYRLTADSQLSNMIVAKEDHYFVYPTDYNYYNNKYKDTFQHGGISLEEMLLPVVILEAR